MALKFKKGDLVKQIVSLPFEGEITDIKVDADTGEVLYHVLSTDGERYFTEDQIEAE